MQYLLRNSLSRKQKKKTITIGVFVSESQVLLDVITKTGENPLIKKTRDLHVLSVTPLRKVSHILIQVGTRNVPITKYDFIAIN
jgi:hypothetical protein